jgi:molecular chaperone DnaK (HSP70)
LEEVPSEYIWPWEVSAMILDKMRSIAERGLEQRRVKLAVIGVPANFQDAQKKETMKAAEKVGFQKVE